MRKLAIGVALASTALAGPAFARDKAWYVGVRRRRDARRESNYYLAGVNNALAVKQHYGYDVDGIVGYDFGPIRIEGEAGYKRSEVEHPTLADPVPSSGLPGGSSIAAAVSATPTSSASWPTRFRLRRRVGHQRLCWWRCRCGARQVGRLARWCVGDRSGRRQRHAFRMAGDCRRSRPDHQQHRRWRQVSLLQREQREARRCDG